MFARDPKAKPGQPGHHTYLHHPQGKGRIDNPHMYDAWYFAEKPEAAVGEVRGDVSVWSDEMFETPFLPGGRYALGRFRLPDNVALLDLDHASHLAERNLRPSEVVSRVRNTTQGWAASIFQEAQHDGSRKWAGVKWWSFQRPQWVVFCLWVPRGAALVHEFVDCDPLYVTDAAVIDAAAALTRPFR
ncbi:MAG: RES domain-containing protein [Nakamurella sp.]